MVVMRVIRQIILITRKWIRIILDKRKYKGANVNSDSIPSNSKTKNENNENHQKLEYKEMGCR